VTLRMVFGRQDLQRVRLAGGADPMWELVLGLHMAQAPRVPAPFVRWRQGFDRRLVDADRLVDAMSPLTCLVAPHGAFPDFLTPPGPVTDFDRGCEAVLCTPRPLLSTDLAVVFARRTAPQWIRSLAGGDRRTMNDVVRALRTAHDLLVAPCWSELCDVVAADRAMRARQLAAHGVSAVLANVPGVLSWDGEVLLVRYPVDRTVYLDGRGLVLLPSYFCWASPVTWIDSELPPVLVYQAHNRHVRSQPTPNVPDRLMSLLGRTRAECLHALLVPRTTTELAELLGTSIGTASKQAALLRDTGLVTSSRRGSAVLHTTTSLGTALLVGEPACAGSSFPAPGIA
jgi:DNA-binding transcriptional ArsR family regulator